MLGLSNKIFSLKYKLVLLSEKDLIFKYRLMFLDSKSSWERQKEVEKVYKRRKKKENITEEVEKE